MDDCGVCFGEKNTTIVKRWCLLHSESNCLFETPLSGGSGGRSGRFWEVQLGQGSEEAVVRG